MISQREMDGSNTGNFKPFNVAAFVLFVKQILDLVNSKYGSKPIPLVVMPDVEANIGI